MAAWPRAKARPAIAWSHQGRAFFICNVTPEEITKRVNEYDRQIAEFTELRDRHSQEATELQRDIADLTAHREQLAFQIFTARRRHRTKATSRQTGKAAPKLKAM